MTINERVEDDYDMPVPTEGIPDTPDLSTPDVLIPVVEGVWRILVDDDEGLQVRLDQVDPREVGDLWASFVEWTESLVGNDPERHVYADSDACRVGAFEDLEEVRQNLTEEVLALPMAAQISVAQAAVAAAALAQCLFETGRIDIQHRPFWVTWWTSMVAERELHHAHRDPPSTPPPDPEAQPGPDHRVPNPILTEPGAPPEATPSPTDDW